MCRCVAVSVALESGTIAGRSQPVTRRRIAALVAISTALWVYLGLFLTVRHNYGSNWTAMYRTGSAVGIPRALANEGIYEFAGSCGFDGQFYHYMTHDPLLRRGLDSQIDAPRYRYRRILIPGLAAALAFGRDEFVHAAYIAVLIGFIALGAYWLAYVCAELGKSPLWGFGFALVPATVFSAERMTVDAGAVALYAGFAYYLRKGSNAGLFAVAAAAALVRETGSLIAIALVIDSLLRRQYRRASFFAASLVPILAWTAYVHARTAPYDLPLTFIPFYSLWQAALRPGALEHPAVFLSTALNLIALGGTWMGFVMAFLLVRKTGPGPLQISCGLLALLGACVLSTPDWHQVYDYGRVFSPLALLLALEAVRLGWRAALFPLASTLPRTFLQLAPGVLGVWRGLTR